MAFKLSIHDAIASQIGGEVLRYNATTLGGLPAFSIDDPPPAGYTEVSSLANWELYGWATGLSLKTYRNVLINQYLSGWATMSDDDKRVLVNYHVFPTSTTQAELDALWTQLERKSFRQNIIARLQRRRRLIRESPDETLWIVKINNSGVRTSIELKTDVAL